MIKIPVPTVSLLFVPSIKIDKKLNSDREMRHAKEELHSRSNLACKILKFPNNHIPFKASMYLYKPEKYVKVISMIWTKRLVKQMT